MTDVRIYSDGSCSPNPGDGGWGAIIDIPGRERLEINGGEPDTTNNRMEMTAVLEAVRQVDASLPLVITTDSQYIQKAFTAGWLKQWERNGWRTAARKPVKNKDLWVKLVDALEERTVRWEWIEGHQGHAENERCDELANEARMSL